MNNGRKLFNWSNERRDRVNTVAHDQAVALRVARRVLPLVGPQGEYVDNVRGHLIDAGPPLSVHPNQRLQPLEISIRFELFPEQFDDDETLQALVRFAAAQTALGEDAVVLLGADAGNFLQQVRVELRSQQDLQQQEGLFDRTPRPVGQPILDSILQGIQQLEQRGQFGDYVAIVSPDLYREAYTPRQSLLDAPIYQIQPLLRQNGFLYSEAAPAKTGVIFSLARATISLNVSVDTSAEFLVEEQNAQLRVVEQFRLIVDDRNAREQLI